MTSSADATPGGRPTYAVGVSGVRWVGDERTDRPVFLAASVFASSLRSDGTRSASGPSVVVPLIDPTPLARIDLDGERSWTTPWSARAQRGDLCGHRVEPLRTLRKLVWGSPPGRDA